MKKFLLIQLNKDEDFTGVYTFFVEGYEALYEIIKECKEDFGLAIVEGTKFNNECNLYEHCNEKGCLAIVELN